jgi:hypothetical protein
LPQLVVFILQIKPEICTAYPHIRFFVFGENFPSFPVQNFVVFHQIK